MLIKHGWDSPTAEEIAAEPARFDALPLDGVTIFLPGLRSDVLSVRRRSAAEFAAAIRKIPPMKRVTHNYAVVTMHEASYDLNDTALWSAITSNLEALAAAIKNSPSVEGIMIDLEYYGSGRAPWDYRHDRILNTGSDATAMRAVARQRGFAIMHAMARAHPQIKVFMLPGIGHTCLPVKKGGVTTYPNPCHYELLEPFMYGMASATVGTSSALIDAGEHYGLAGRNDFTTNYNLRKNLRTQNSLESAELTDVFRTNASFSFGVYDRDNSAAGYPALSAVTVAAKLRDALTVADQYVWLYTEAYDWFPSSKGKMKTVPGAYVTTFRSLYDELVQGKLTR